MGETVTPVKDLPTTVGRPCAGMNGVDQRLEVQGVAAGRVDTAGVVAHHAILHTLARTPVHGEALVAAIAAAVSDDVELGDARRRAGRRLEGIDRAVRHDGGARGIGDAADFETYPMGERAS